MNSHFYLAAALLGAAAVLAEHGISKVRRIEAYRFADTVNNLSHFVGELSLTSLLYLNVFTGYELLVRHIALVALPEGSLLTWAFALLLVDLVYYAGHRLCHEVGALWALHAVHHQSGELNLSVGLRGPWLSALQIAPFMIPIALLGVPVSVLFPIYAFHTVWKLLVHTRLVGRLGPLELVFATPSQHRVHHAQNERFLDKNFGGLFSVWDRLFGTFQVEDEAPRFAPAPALSSLDPLENNLAPWRELLGRARRVGLLRAFLGSPGAGAAPRPAAPAAATAPLSRRQRGVAAAQLVASATVALLLLSIGDALPPAARWIAGLWALASLTRLGLLLRPDQYASSGARMPVGIASGTMVTAASPPSSH